MTAPVVDAVVLAAGLSRRMAPDNKLLARNPAGQALIAVTVAAIRTSALREVIVVVGHDGDRVAATVAARDVRVVRCAAYAQGQSASLRAGLAALAPQGDAVLVCLGDMPLIDGAVIEALIAAWQPGMIVAPRCGGRRGNPVLWDRSDVAAMACGAGDRGAAWLIEQEMARVRFVDLPSDAVLRDADTAEALAALPGGPWKLG